MNIRPAFLLLAALAAIPGVRAAYACCRALPPVAAAPLPGTSLYQLDATWTTDAGRPIKLAELRGRPVVIAMFYASCGYACPRIVAAMMRIEHDLPPAVRARTRFVLVSFDDVRDTVPVLQAYRQAHGLAPADWVLLRGAPGDIRELAAALGVTYERQANGMFNHSNLITVLNAEGEIIHQRAGLEGGLAEATQAVVASR